MIKNYSIGKDLFAGVVVFLVALPLCLGIANASGVAPTAGLVSGIIGGLLVAVVSRSALSVSGPAAGLVLIVVSAITSLGLPAFLVAVVMAGAIQILLGLLKAGFVVKLIPGSVIKGMMTSIGLMLIIKQLPVAVGLSSALVDPHAVTLLWEIHSPAYLVTPIGHHFSTAIVIALLSLALLFGWESAWARNFKLVRLVPGPMVTVLLGVLLAWLSGMISPGFMLPTEYRVAIPSLTSLQDLLTLLPRPDWTQVSNPDVWHFAVVLGVVASLESLLSIEAVEQIDPLRRRVSPNRELIAQGIGNLVAGFLGALPITSVIVRSSANVYAGAQTRLSCIIHGLLLLLGLIILPSVLRLVPLACLAAVLLQTGYKLSKPSLIRSMAHSGRQQFLPFIATVAGVLVTDLLFGILIGVAVSLSIMLHAHLQRVVTLTQYDDSYLLAFRKDVSFLAKPYVSRCLDSIPAGATLIIDAERADFIDKDIIDMLLAFMAMATQRKITIEMQNWPWANAMEVPSPTVS